MIGQVEKRQKHRDRGHRQAEITAPPAAFRRLTLRLSGVEPGKTDQGTEDIERRQKARRPRALREPVYKKGRQYAEADEIT